MTSDETCCELTLFVSGASDLSVRAIATARALADTHLAGRYNLSVVDVHDGAAAAVSSGVVVTPTLVKTWPLPVRRFVGDLSQADRVLLALDLQHVQH
jgi:circadian clock protein KaiB